MNIAIELLDTIDVLKNEREKLRKNRKLAKFPEDLDMSQPIESALESARRLDDVIRGIEIQMSIAIRKEERLFNAKECGDPVEAEFYTLEEILPRLLKPKKFVENGGADKNYRLTLKRYIKKDGNNYIIWEPVQDKIENPNVEYFDLDDYTQDALYIICNRLRGDTESLQKIFRKFGWKDTIEIILR